MSKKLTAYICGVVFLVVGFFGLFSPGLIKATDQVCKIGGNCVIGEFLFDDNYTPINSDASCRLTSRKPNGDVFLNAVTLSIGTSDGWYSYSVNTNEQSEGLYPSQVCCTIGIGTTEYMCLDKTFKMEAAGALSSDISNLSAGISNVQTTVSSIETKVDSLNTKVTGIGTTVGSILTKWGNYSAAEILTNINGVNTNIGTTADTCVVDSVFGNIACVRDKWGAQTAQTLYDAANGALGIGTSLRAELNYNGKSTTAYEDLQSLKNYVDSLETNIGESTDLSSSATLFGKIKSNKEDIAGVQTTVNSIVTSLSTLVYDVWHYTERALTGFGSLVASIWSNTNRTLTDSTLNEGQLTTNQSIGTSLSELSTGISNVQTTVNSVETKINTLNGKVDTIDTKVGSLITKWGDYSALDIYNRIEAVNIGIGNTADTCVTDSVFGNIACVRDKWGAQTAQTLYDAANGALGIGTSLRAELNYNGKSTTAWGDIQSMIGYINSLQGLVGENDDLASNETLFGKLKSNKEDINTVSGQVAGVQSTITEISGKMDNLSTQIGGVGTNISSILTKWDTYSIADVLNNISGVSTKLGTTSDTCIGDETIFGYIQCVRDKWGDKTADGLYTVADNAYDTISDLRGELNYNGKSTTAYADIQTLKTSVASLQSLVGTADDESTTATIFGKINKVQIAIDILDSGAATADSVINNWGSLSASDIYDKVKNLSSEIAAVNTVSNVSSILTLNQTNSTDITTLKNQVLSLQALISMNQTLLEKSVNQPIIKTWMEEGSIVFKTMITNPSTVKQSVPLKFYLPKEAKNKDIMKVDDGVMVEYDTSNESLYITGNFNLTPNETKIISVEVTDIWKIAETEMDSLKMQTEELSKPLEKTSYFAQGVTLKADILANLKNVKRKQSEAVTPEAKIQVYRENLVQINKIKDELKELQSLVSALSSTNTMTGFVGGAQTVSLWGMILIIVVSVVSVTIYMRIIIIKSQREKRNKITSDEKPEIENYKNKNKFDLKKVYKKNWVKMAGLSLVVVIACAATFKLTWTILDGVSKRKTANEAIVKVEEAKRKEIAQIPTTKPMVLGVDTFEEEKSKIVGNVNVILPIESTSSVKLRAKPNLDAEILGKIWAKQEVDKYEENQDWTKIGINIKTEGVDKYIIGWIRNQFIEK